MNYQKQLIQMETSQVCPKSIHTAVVSRHPSGGILQSSPRFIEQRFQFWEKPKVAEGYVETVRGLAKIYDFAYC